MTGRVELGPGDGVVVVLGDVALLALSDQAPDRLLSVVRAAAITSTAPGSRLARGLATLLTSDDADTIPSFGALADTDDGLLIFLYGPVVAQMRTVDGSETRLSGSEAATWVDRVFRSGIDEVVLSAEGRLPLETSATRFELTAGVVPGGWLRLSRDPAAARSKAPAQQAPPADGVGPVTAEPEIAPLPPMPLPPPVTETTGLRSAPKRVSEELPHASSAFVSIPLTPDQAILRPPLAVEAPGEATPEERECVAELVEGILCSRQHFNSPDARYCSSCGISMVHQTHNLVRRPRPPLGFLVFDDGSAFTLDERCVLGREPETDPLVQRGEARPLALEDEQMSVSRIHAEIRLVGWDVLLVDRGSTNGTHILDETGDEWERLVPDEPRILVRGSRGALGQRRFAYESPQRG